MITHSFKVSFNLGPVIRGEEDEAFKWIRRLSPIAKYITSISFSYNHGWDVECVHPIEIGPHQMSELFFNSYKQLHTKPWLPLCSPVQSTLAALEERPRKP